MMRRLLDVAAMSVVYYAAAHVGLFLAVPGTNVSPMWPATGLALAAVVWRGPHVAIGVVVGEAAANAQVFLGDGTGLPLALGVSLAYGAGNAAEVLLGGWLYKHWVGARFPTRTLHGTWGLARTAAVACSVSAFAGIATLLATGLVSWPDAPEAWFTWWLGNVAGIALFTPLALELSRPREVDFSPMKAPEASALMAASMLVPALIFSGMLTPIGLGNPMLLIALVLWAAFRSTPVATSAAMAMTATVSITAVAAGASPIVVAPGDLVGMGISVTVGAFLILLAQASLQDRFHAYRRQKDRSQGLARALQTETVAAKDAAMRHDAVFAHALEGIVTVDDGLHIVEANQSAQDLLGGDTFELIGESLDDHLPGALEALRTRRHRSEGELRTGTPVDVSWTTWTLAGATFHTAFIRDATERREAEQRRQEAREAELALQSMAEQAAFRTQFLNHAAHEIRTPMTPLLLQISILRHMDDEMPDTAGRAVAAIQRNLVRLKRILDDMLDVGRFQAGRLEVKQDEVDIVPLVRNVIDDHMPVLTEKRIKLSVHMVPSANVRVDADRIQQILSNLLSNAAKYTPEDGHVRVEVDHRLGAVEVRVKDDGLGLDADQKARLFQPFSRVHQDLPIPGTGLGLYVSQSLARLHQGDLSVTSKGRGKGSCFTLRLPAPGFIEKTVQYSDSSPGRATTSGRGSP